ncbi:unnamed protein product [Hymenolepis diminuta]|uniref:Uncharacterized protein n=1 Tax=Hymenolepis diminuta TaxID=6216 RepID=A0A564XZS0_HYMDI|nr:unnamed protein product [Hymenolepis diminuta]
MRPNSNEKACNNCATAIEEILFDLSRKLTCLDYFLWACTLLVTLGLYPYSSIYPSLIPILHITIFFGSRNIEKVMDEVQKCIYYIRHDSKTLN